MEEFSAAIITRNEGKVIGRLLESLKGVEDIVVVDTGSTDDTVEIAKSYGCRVFEEGDRFKIEATEYQEKSFRDTFGIQPSFKAGHRYFHFSNARNYALKHTKHDFVFQPDADEVVVWDLPRVKELLTDCDQLVYQFCFAHNPDGSNGLTFDHCKFFRKSKLKWVNQVHEIHAPVEGQNPKPPTWTDAIFHHHWQEEKEERGNYLPALEMDVLNNPKNDRNCYYLARELVYQGKWQDAVTMFDHALKIMWWKPERGQAYIYLAQAYEKLGNREKQIECLLNSLKECDSRREPWFELGNAFASNPVQATYYYGAAMNVEFNQHGYLNDESLYSWIIPERLSAMYGKMGNFEKSKYWWVEAVKNGAHMGVIHALPAFFGEFPIISIIIPHLPCREREEGLTKVLDSVKKLNYPQHRLDVQVIVDEPRKGVPERVHEGYLASKGDYVVFAATDTEFTPQSLIIAFLEMQETGKRLLAFNTDTVGWDGGNECEHFMIKKDLVPELGGEIFCRRFNHVGCDVLLKTKAKKLNEFYRSEKAVMIHNHFSKTGKSDSVYEAGWSKVDEDRKILVEELDKIGANDANTSIPKKIFTIWVGGSIPQLVEKCINTKYIQGYEHKVITNDTFQRGIPYVEAAISAKKWVKAVDYLRLYYLYNEGGIYLDSDMEILPNKNFDDMLYGSFFVGREDNGFIANSIIGATKGHPILKKAMEEMEKGFTGDDDKVFESGMELFTNIVSAFNGGNVKIYPSDFFFPYNHQTGITNVTGNSRTLHHFMKSWKS